MMAQFIDDNGDLHNPEAARFGPLTYRVRRPDGHDLFVCAEECTTAQGSLLFKKDSRIMLILAAKEWSAVYVTFPGHDFPVAVSEWVGYERWSSWTGTDAAPGGE